jgi:polyphosphate kinase
MAISRSPSPGKAPRKRAVKARPAYEGSGVFIDRELSWLAFNHRVLEEAQNATVPLLERLKFIAIVGNNLDEFFEVRVASLLQRIESGAVTDGIAQLDAQGKLENVLTLAQQAVGEQYRCWETIRGELRRSGTFVKELAELAPEEEVYARAYFRREVYPLLTPITVDPSHPFPRLLNKALCLALILKTPGKGREAFGVITVPRSLSRVIPLSPEKNPKSFLFIADLVRHYAADIFKGYSIRECVSFRATRNSNLYIGDEDLDGEEGSLLEAVEEEVRNRRRGDVVRLEIEKDASATLVEFLRDNLDVEPGLIFRTGSPVNLNRITALYSLIPQPGLKFPAYAPAHTVDFSDAEEMFAQLRSRDVLLHHPFDSYDPVVRFIEAAAQDPQVLAVKTTLYRTSDNSPIMYALMEAAQRGKEVVVVVELTARFDEQSNIRWARQLEERGGTVIYGLGGLKTHCKLALVVRREKTGYRRYAHVGTGNYNPETARFYTDFSLFTSHRDTTGGIFEVFNHLTANTRRPDFRGLWVSPISFLSGTLDLIRRERENARAGRPSGILAKFNALLDKEVIEALYDASRDGVPVRLIVRGICSLRPGVPGLSGNIRVKSVVGRFLEHSRVFCFRNGGEEEMFIGSGDWMARNLRERVEVLAPVRDPVLRARLARILSVYWRDNTATWWMRHDGGYERAKPADGETPLNAQEFFMQEASGTAVEPVAMPGLWE